MNYSLFTFRSVTPAQRGERILKASGVSCSLRRTPKWMEEQGCGYSLRVPHKDAQRCAELLRENQVHFRKAYWLRDSGVAEEMWI